MRRRRCCACIVRCALSESPWTRPQPHAALGEFHGGLGMPSLSSPGRDSPSRGRRVDGGALLVSSTEIGQGTRTMHAQIVADR